MEVSHNRALTNHTTSSDVFYLIRFNIFLYFRGATDFGDTIDMQMKVQGLKEKKQKMEESESELDKQCAKIKQCLKNIVEDPGNNRYPLILFPFYILSLSFHVIVLLNFFNTLAYVTYEDIRSIPCFKSIA